MESTDWRKRLYDSYVSSGQANRSISPNTQPADREEFAKRFFGQCQYAARLIKRHMPLDKKARVIDLGCGHGVFLYFLARAGYSNISGVDFSMEQISVAHQLGIVQARQGSIEACLAETETASVDVILLMDVLEHLTREALFETLDEAFRVLRPGGTCLALVPNGEGLQGMRVRYGDLTHEWAFTQKSAEQLFRTVGFSSVPCFEQQPAVHGFPSFVRRAIWSVGTMPRRVLLSAETGTAGCILSQNLIIAARK